MKRLSFQGFFKKKTHEEIEFHNSIQDYQLEKSA